MAAAGIRMGKVFVEIGADPSEFKRALSTINKSIGNLGKRLTMAGAALTAAGTAITGALAGAAANFANVGDSIQKMSARTGASAKFLTEMGFAAEQSGSNLTTFGNALFRMTRRVGNFSQGTGPAVRALTDLGFAADSFVGMSTEQTFNTLVEALSRVEDPALRAQYAFEIFGDQARALMPLLNSGAAGIAAMRAEAERLGLSFDDQAADQAAALADAMNRLKRVLEIIVFQVGGAVAPMFTEFYNTMAAAAAGIGRFVKENGDMVRSVLKAGLAITAAGGVLVGLGLTLQAVSFSLAGITGAVSGLLSPFVKLGAAVVTAISQFGLLTVGVLKYAAVSTVSAATTAAAWAIANAPLVLIAGALLGIGAAVVQAYGGFEKLGNAISSALSGIPGLLGNAGAQIGETFSTVVSDAKTVFGDLYASASTTFGGISDALAAGDLAAAASMAWLGLQAVWLRGIQAIMSYTDPFIEALQNIWGDLQVGTISIFDGLFTYLRTTFNSAFAVIQGIVDNVVVGLLNTFDDLITNIKIAWTRVQGFISGAEDTQERVDKIKTESEARQEQRRQDMPGIEGRQQQAEEKNREIREAAAERKRQREQELEDAKTARANRTNQRAQARQAAVDDVEGKLGQKRDEMADLKAAAQLTQQLGSVTDAGQLAQIGEQVAALIDRGNLPVEREEALTKAYQAASSRIGQTDASQLDPDAGRQASQSSSEVAGTFSSAGVGGMGFGSNLVKEQLDTLKKIEENTREPAAVQ